MLYQPNHEFITRSLKLPEVAITPAPAKLQTGYAYALYWLSTIVD